MLNTNSNNCLCLAWFHYFFLVYVFSIVIGIQAIDLNDEKQILLKELGNPLRMKAFGEIRLPSLRNINYNRETKNNYSVEISNLDNNIFQISYYLKIHNKDAKISSCGFKYRFNNTVFPILVKRGELLGTLVCEDKLISGKLSQELPILSYCYGQVQLVYPFLPLPIIFLREEDIFLAQLCARKFPDFNGIPYKFPIIPLNQSMSFNNTLFEVNHLRLENKHSKMIYRVKKQSKIIECVLNRLFHGKSFQVVEFSIIGVIVCKMKSKDQKIQIVREVIRALCNGISSFQSSNPDSIYGSFKVSQKTPFNLIECLSIPENQLEKRLANPDQAIKDTLIEAYEDC
ncbi:uncharacterized protein cubi_01512 [Cryptosporidium ubiquitum]|uniref:Uncharacterized protein n=1 Tax=Cryptosporidium ubiquitum TaxID=857276 RepID=A0A1J4MFD9_9CRYT|nr:uncharacterized protein cubi_01512 [Cryptosporidium ubiquitum]OII72179.1 hypothetical protein cubi_01512 [Cryptosporidium ubiquitum]